MRVDAWSLHIIPMRIDIKTVLMSILSMALSNPMIQPRTLLGAKAENVPGGHHADRKSWDLRILCSLTSVSSRQA